jgi:MoaA/NifB/PqqE/SkfB family radical SAM enzyme
MLGYQSAETLPWKLIKNHPEMIKDGRIIPQCIHLKPTNRCNVKCDWCSTDARDKTQELSIEEIKQIAKYFDCLGTRAVSISGGGEPTYHPKFKDMIIYLWYELNWRIGLTTNGLPLVKQNLDYLNRALTWCRLSVIESSKDFDISYMKTILAKLPSVDCSITFTVIVGSNMGTVRDVCYIAEHYQNIKHIRFVSDIFNCDTIGVQETMNHIKQQVPKYTDKGIFQYRQGWTPGRKNCLISLLKPQINAEGYIEPCCGIQYANPNMHMNEFKMCHWKLFAESPAFDGSVCTKCYYDNYNLVLGQLLQPIEHEEFV